MGEGQPVQAHPAQTKARCGCTTTSCVCARRSSHVPSLQPRTTRPACRLFFHRFGVCSFVSLGKSEAEELFFPLRKTQRSVDDDALLGFGTDGGETGGVTLCPMQTRGGRVTLDIEG